MSNKEEVHDALCPALTGGKCGCTESPVTVDKACRSSAEALVVALMRRTPA